MGRFTSPDTPFVDQNVYDPQSWNLYSYGRNNPLVNIDPTGRSCVKTTSDGKEGYGDDGDGKGCKEAGVPSDSKGGMSASEAYRVNVYGGANAAQAEVTDALKAFVTDGPKRIEYGPDDPFTQSFQNSIGMDAIRAGVKKDCSKTAGLVAVSTPEAFVNALIDGIVGGMGFYNPNAQMGAFSATYQRSGGAIDVTVTNPISLNSAAYHLTSKLGIGNPAAGPFGTVHQTIRMRAADPCSAP